MDEIPLDPGLEAELRYRDLILGACDVIGLASLPRAEERLALAPDLRRLYVPLRVKTVMTAETQARRKDLAAVESRRVSLGEKLGEVRRLVVLGEPGAGKTTLLHWLATAYVLRLKSIREWLSLPDAGKLPPEPFLPVVISCRDLDAEALAGSLDDILRHTLRRTEMSDGEARDLLARLREQLPLGRVLLLFDGLDAVAGLAARVRFCRQIEQISAAFPKTPIVVTSRPAGYRDMGFRLSRGFEHVEICELSREDKETFAHLWFQLTEPRLDRRERQAEDLIRGLHSSNRIERLTGNPMLLTTLALVNHKVGKLPQRRADLYWEAVQMLLQWGGEPVELWEALPQLEYLAWAMSDRGVQQLPENEVLGLLEELRRTLPATSPVQARSAADFLRLLERRTGILRRGGEGRYLGMTVPVFEFRHLTFQEYLAARALVDGHVPGRDSQRSLADSVRSLAGRTITMPDGEVAVSEHWRETLRLCAACAGDAAGEVLLALLHPLPGEDAAVTARPRAVLAGLCLADEPRASEDVAWEILAALALHVRGTEGSLLWRTSLDNAVRELAESRWGPDLRLALVREFRARDAVDRWSIGFLCIKLAALSALHEGEDAPAAESLPVFSPLPADREDEAVALALDAVGSAFSSSLKATPAQAGRLMDLLGASPAAAHAAAWGLYSLLGRRWEAEPWSPTDRQLERMAALAADPGLDPGAAWCLIKILGLEKFEPAVGLLLELRQGATPDLQEAAADALQRIAAPGTVDSLIRRWNESGDGLSRRTGAS